MIADLHTLGATLATIVVAATSAEMPLVLLLLQRISRR
jgi:hypothetical protein